ncbi:hypothetical protein J6590_011603 [Homalodisca vitripennis]|nr:hypothetical protein J6590_011603 [Homalodisca vitripennis]
MQKRCLYSLSGLGFPPFHQRHTPVKRCVSASLEGNQTSCSSERLVWPDHFALLVRLLRLIQLSLRWEGPRADRKPNTRPPSSWITGLRHESRPTTAQSVSHISVPSSLVNSY